MPKPFSAPSINDCSDLYVANDAHSASARPIARPTAAIFAWLLPARPSFRPKTGCVFPIVPQKETVSRFGAGTAEKLDRYLVLIGVCVNR